MSQTSSSHRDGNAGNADLPIGSIPECATRESGVPSVPRWHSRGYLPHFEGAEVTQHVTFHLADSLPAKVVQQLAAERRSGEDGRSGDRRSRDWRSRETERRKRIEAWLDAGYGSCVLREPCIGEMVERAFLFFDGQRYRLFAWVVMPNYVHVLFQPTNGWSVAKIVASWKKFTATRICAFRRDANREIGVPGTAGNADLPIGFSSPVWHREYWDRYMRDQRHFEQAMEYIHQNPVKAGLVTRPQDWQWSSARAR